MFGISGFELLIILIFGFILVGDRLPDVAKTLGRAIRTFQSAQRDMSKVIKEDVFDPNAEEPFKDPLAALDKMGGIAKKTGSSLAGDLNEMASIAKKKKPAASAASNGAATVALAQNAVSADNAAGAGNTAAATANAGKEAPAETFAERRARYEKERAARLAAQAEQKAAEEAAAAAAAVQAADATVSQVEAQQAEAAAPVTDAPETSAADAAPATAPSTAEGRE